MRRLDRLLGEARLFRIKRAAVAQGICQPPADFDWFAEAGAVQVLLGDLNETELPPDADKRRLEPIQVLDIQVLEPFLAAASEAVLAVIAAQRPQDLVFAPMWDRVSAVTGYPDADEDHDAGRPRESAVRDVAAMAVQMALFEVVRRVASGMDLERRVSVQSDPQSIVIEGGRARRMRRPRAIENAKAMGAAALAGLAVPPPQIAPPAKPDKVFAKAAADLRVARRIEKAAAAKAKALAAADALARDPALDQALVEAALSEEDDALSEDVALSDDVVPSRVPADQGLAADRGSASDQRP